MWFKAFAAVSFLATFNYLVKLWAVLDLGKELSLYDHSPGPCVEVMKDGGAEDLTYLDDGRHGYILFSHGIGLARGDLRILDLSLNPPNYRVLNITNPPTKPGFMAKPHGISTWKDPTAGSITVFVITHPDSGDRIEVFDLIGYKVLKHLRTITNRKFIDLNDLVAIDKDKFYVTQWSQYKEWWAYFIEVALNQGSGEVFYYDGKRAKSVATGFLFANGINISPDKSTVYVADFGNKRLVGFKKLLNNDLVQLWEEDMNTAVDNIEVDKMTGDLWIGCHPMLYRILLEIREEGNVLPANVLKVKMKDNMVSEVIEVFSDREGRRVAGAGAAMQVRDKLIIGAVLDQLVVCDVKYIR